MAVCKLPVFAEAESALKRGDTELWIYGITDLWIYGDREGAKRGFTDSRNYGFRDLWIYGTMDSRRQGDREGAKRGFTDSRNYGFTECASGELWIYGDTESGISCVPMVLLVAALGKSDKVERQAIRDRATETGIYGVM